MMPAGPLMKEHRLIERMIALMDNEIRRIESGRKADVNFIETAIDFIRIYADRCHHGKEEDILFRELKMKDITEEHERVMNELIREHVWGRETVGKLDEAKRRYHEGGDSLDEIVELMGKLTEFYPKHIDKEDNRFFLPAMEYFSRQEQDAMLDEMAEFDREMIHDKYGRVVERMS